MSVALETDRKETLREQDVERLHDDNLHAAQIVVGLMTGVFAIGLVMYAFILWIVW